MGHANYIRWKSFQGDLLVQVPNFSLKEFDKGAVKTDNCYSRFGWRTTKHIVRLSHPPVHQTCYHLSQHYCFATPGHAANESVPVGQLADAAVIYRDVIERLRSR